MSNLNSRNKLTEFPPLEPEEKPDGLKFSFSKFIWWKKASSDVPSKSDGDTCSIGSDTDSFYRNHNRASAENLASSTFGTSLPINEQSIAEENVKKYTSALSSPELKRGSNVKMLSVSTKSHLTRSDSSLSNTSPDLLEGNVSPFEARTLPNVLRRISNLIAMGTHNQTDIKKYWMPDSVSKECYDCAEKFTTFRRKHHCRICGQIFCSRCCSQEIPGKIIGYSGDLRVCTYCCKIVLSYLNSADLNTDLTSELKLVQEDLQNRFGGNSGTHEGLNHSSGQQQGSLSSLEHIASYRSLPRRKASLVYQEERFVGNENTEGNTDGTEDGVKSIADWVSVKSMWDDMCHPITGIDWSSHRQNVMKNYSNCAVGSELVDWLLAQRKITWRGQGVQIGQMLIDVNLIECISQVEQVFLDAYALYRPVSFPIHSSVLEDIPESIQSARNSVDFSATGHQDPLWMKQINMNKGVNRFEEEDSGSLSLSFTSISNITTPEDPNKTELATALSLYSLDLNTNENIVFVSKQKEKEHVDPYNNQTQTIPSTKTTPKNSRKPTGSNSSVTTEAMTDEFLQNTLMAQKDRIGKENEMVLPAGWHLPQQLTTDAELLAFQNLCNAFIRHENELLIELLERMSLSSSWADIILPIVHKVTEIVRPDVRHADDDMDIRQYVQFKKVSGGSQQDCRIVNGVVCTKNVAHRLMKTKLKAPRVLLIGSAIDYQRFENRFLSLEPLVMQEYDYLRNTVSRIASLSPNLVLVEKSVSRLAQEFLLEMGITLVLNVKSSVMERVARSTQGIIESSADTPIGRPQLGLCHNFYLESFNLVDGSSKTLMFFDGCATHLGCTVLLRGGTNRELMRVKKIMSLMILVAYNWRLERSFHIDLFAMPPNEVQRERPKDFNFLLSPESEVDPVGSIPEIQNLTKNSRLNSDSSAETISAVVPENKNALKTEACDDLSDPLRSSLDLRNETSTEDLALVVKHVSDPAESNVKRYSFKKCLVDVILSASPFITYGVPYLETEEGKKCKLRSFFPEEIYWSSQLYGRSEQLSLFESPESSSFTLGKMNNPHPLALDKLSEPLDSDHVQDLIADFRRKGHRPMHTPNSTMKTNNLMDSDADDRSNFEVVNTNGRVDALDPFKHQKLSVLFCSFSRTSCNFPSFCVNPWVVNMDMYGRNDISLGMFLERYCFRKTYLCPSKACDQPMISSHLRRFVHEHGCITVSLKELEKSISGSIDNILMWNWCTKCETLSPIVPMSVDAWSLSFAKYLELRFQGNHYTRRSHGSQMDCPHSLHHDNIQYFAQGNIFCAFKYSSIKIWEICLPLTSISVKKEPKTVIMLIDDVKTVAITGHGVYTNILEILVSLRETSNGLRVEEVVKALLDQLKAEQNVFRSRIEDIQMNLTSPSLKITEDSPDVEPFLWRVTDSIGFLKSFVSETIQDWNLRLHDVDILRKKEEKQSKGAGKVSTDTNENTTKSLIRIDSDASLLEPTISHVNSTSSFQKTLEESNKSDDPMHAKLELSKRDSITSASTVDMTISGLLEELPKIPLPPIPPILINHLDDGNITLNNISAPTAISNPPSPNLPTTTTSTVNERLRGDSLQEKPLRSFGDNLGSGEDSAESKLERKHTTNTVKNLMSHFISTPIVPIVQSPWMPIEHHFQAALTTMPVIVYENEPSSVVAFALSSNEYQTKRMDLMKLSPQGQSNGSKFPILLAEEDNHSIGGKKPKLAGDSSEEFSLSYSSQNCVIGNDEKVAYFDGDGGEEKEMNSKGQSHIEVQFASNTAKFYCRVYFAEKFRQLRKMCITEGEEFYVRSISRCVSWAASGGKSGSTFCKTNDDRFVIKQMSKFEIDSFLDIAPNYFNYIKVCYQDKKPTVLAKIVGVYRIGFKNSQNNAASKQDILVMENLFYQRRISQKFDLKGSIRNRLAATSGKMEDLVLLDENLVNMACESPLYIRPHTKKVLTMAIINDSKFLASQMVMDYSLLVGLDEESNELVVGVIDYIRTFTWDKKIEAFVKSSGILGGQGKTPTVISPEEYQTRFCEAMYRYFLLVPDRWIGLGLGIDS